MFVVRSWFGFCLFAVLCALGCNKRENPQPQIQQIPEPQPGEVPKDKPESPEVTYTRDTIQKLKLIGKALHEVHDSYGNFPAGIVSPKGQLGLSWRVAILPFLGEAALSKEFKLNEPWDSEHNKKLIPKMPKVFAKLGQDASEGKTVFRSITGPLAAIPATRTPPKGMPKGFQERLPWSNQDAGQIAMARRITEISDGTVNTILVAEATEAVEWTKPDELIFADEFPTVIGANFKPTPLPKLGRANADSFIALMFFGEAFAFSKKLEDKTLRAMLTVNGGEVLPPEVNEILFPKKPNLVATPNTIPELLPDVAARTTIIENYRKITKGIYRYHQRRDFFPIGISGNKSMGLSWRVQILPDIGEEALYKQFKLDEPWDSENNMKLIEKMPAVFASPNGKTAAGHTFVRTTQGDGGLVQAYLIESAQRGQRAPGTALRGLALPRVLDGIANTILFAEANESVPWTKPDEIPVPFVTAVERPDPTKVPKLGGVFPNGFHIVLMDGSIAFCTTQYPNSALEKLLTPNGGEVVELVAVPSVVMYLMLAPKDVLPAAKK